MRGQQVLQEYHISVEYIPNFFLATKNKGQGASTAVTATQ
jgi:hypothetical protein